MYANLEVLEPETASMQGDKGMKRLHHHHHLERVEQLGSRTSGPRALPTCGRSSSAPTRRRRPSRSDQPASEEAQPSTPCCGFGPDSLGHLVPGDLQGIIYRQAGSLNNFSGAEGRLQVILQNRIVRTQFAPTDIGRSSAQKVDNARRSCNQLHVIA